MRRISLPDHRRPASITVLVLGCIAIAVPLLSNLASGNGMAEAERAYVSAERPGDRRSNGLALGSRPILRRGTASAEEPSSPRLVQPRPLFAALPDAAIEREVAQLSASAARPAGIADTPSPVAEDRVPEPRRKPARPKRIAIAEPPPLALEPVAGSVAVTLPQQAVLADAPVIAERPSIPSTAPEPRIALVITAAGLHEATTRRAIDTLPDGITLAFAPIGKRTDTLAQAAIEDGHTILAEIPMEPVNPRRDPGEPLTLRVGNSGEANIARMNKALARVPGASGISSYLGAKFSQSETAAAPVVGEIATRGLFLFENQPNGQSRLGVLARSRDVPYAAGTLAIDSDRNAARMLDRLTALETQARREGVAIGVATAYRDSIETLQRWVAAAERRGIVFVPVTRLADAG